MNLPLVPFIALLLISDASAQADPFAPGKIYKGDELKEKLLEINKTIREIKLADGGQVKWEAITQLDPHGIKVMDGSGVRKIAFDALPKAVREAFGYDREKAAEHLENQSMEDEFAAVKLANERRVAEGELKLSVAKREALDQLKANRRYAELRILFSNDDGVAGFPRYVVPNYSPKFSTLGSFRGYDKNWVLEEEEQREVIFIYGDWKVADGEVHQVELYPVGTYSYTAVSGARKTVRSYATTAAEALERFLEEGRKKAAARK